LAVPGKNVVAEVNTEASSSINLGPLCSDLETSQDDLKFNLNSFIGSVNSLLKSPKNLRLDIKIGLLITKTNESGEKELEFRVNSNFFNRQKMMGMMSGS
jgi:hypothetical protein